MQQSELVNDGQGGVGFGGLTSSGGGVLMVVIFVM